MIDVLVIGGGIAGISVGSRLSDSSKVIILEAEKDLAYHASSRSAATFIENYGNDVVRSLNRASKHYLENDNGGVLSPRGMMLVGKEGQENHFLRDSEAFGLNEISIHEAKQKFDILDSSKVTKVSYRDDVFDLDTDLFFQNFLKRFKKNGGRVYTNSKVLSISYGNNKWVVKTSEQEFEAKLLINASGAWVDEIAKIAGIKPLNFTPYKRSIARIKISDPDRVKSWPMVAGVNEEFYAKPDAGQLIVSPADETATSPHDAWPTEEDLATGIDFLSQIAELSVDRITSSWAGLRTFSPDKALVIGHDKINPEFFWFAGQGGYGFQTSAAASELASELILGVSPSIGRDVSNSLSPSRFY
tara:strand:- start:124 stop:1200 length:1077 start_codon:yes stop_codon:yes gene_type:complete